MRIFAKRYHVAVVTLMMGMACMTSWAQTPNTSEAPSGVRIKKIPQVSTSSWRQKTPVFPVAVAGSGQSSNQPRDWGVFEVEFDVLTPVTAPWIDNLTVNYYVMLKNPKDIQKTYSFLKLTCQYSDIERGGSRYVCAVLPPVVMMRHGTVIGFAVDFLVGGKIVDSKSSEASAPNDDLKKAQARWWEDPNVIDNALTVKREGVLLERSKTPFGLIRIDDFEVAK